VSRSNIFSLALVLSAVSSGIPASAAPPKVGERHPDFTLPGIADGKPVALSDFRGKKVLLIQFASW
jgi:peroxiredoxin